MGAPASACLREEGKALMRYEAAYVYDEALHRIVEQQVYRDHPLRLWRRRVIYWGFPLVTLGFAAFASFVQTRGERGEAEFFWICAAIFLLYTMLVHGIRMYRRSRVIQNRRSGAMRLAEQTITLSDAGVRSDLKEFGSSEMTWISFCRATCSDKMLLLYMSRVDYIAFPRGDRTDAAWATLCSEVEAKAGGTKC